MQLYSMDRYKELIDSKRLKISQLARDIGYGGYQALWNCLNGHGKMSLEKQKKLHYILTGEVIE